MDPLDGQLYVRARGGVEAVVLSMPEVCEVLEAIYALAMAVRLNPKPRDFDVQHWRFAPSSASVPARCSHGCATA